VKQRVWIVTQSGCCGHDEIVAVFGNEQDAIDKADNLTEASWDEWEVD
jgi:hypothetical protein